MTPWSVSPSAGWPSAAARSASALIFAAPSSSEYSEWTCRCAQAGVLTGPPKIGARSDGAAALPAPSGECRSQPLRAVQPALQEGDRGAVPADHGTVAGRARLAAEEVAERLRRHRHRGVRAALGRGAADLHAAAVADGEVPRRGRVARDLLRDGERVVARPPGRDDVGEGAEDEPRLEPPAGARGLGKAQPRGGDGAQELGAALASGDAGGAAEAAELMRHAGDQLGERERVGREVELCLAPAARGRKVLHPRAPAGDRYGEGTYLGDREVVVEGAPD